MGLWSSLCHEQAEEEDDDIKFCGCARSCRIIHSSGANPESGSNVIVALTMCVLLAVEEFLVGSQPCLMPSNAY
ncbi:jg2225 [Pararge aegeria aegeria]|uniref:Jg2225 protein n=1 Tax=Pararge aegeria aegeria TaxID=348720 RepID=A0A8S4QSW5_9NEOP|nr:jg2225 [Pararge aegeria aegeria]